MEELDYTKEYKNMVQPILNKHLKSIFISFIGFGLLGFVGSKILYYFKLEDTFILFLLIPCALFFLYHALSLFGIRCPHCHKQLFVLLSVGKIPILTTIYIGKQCRHCSAKLR